MLITLMSMLRSLSGAELPLNHVLLTLTDYRWLLP
jgi:hypothetical protein